MLAELHVCFLALTVWSRPTQVEPDPHGERIAVDVSLDLVGIVSGDMRASPAFYRHPGLKVSPRAENEPHTEVTTPGCPRVARNIADFIHQIFSDCIDPSGGRGTPSKAFLETRDPLFREDSNADVWLPTRVQKWYGLSKDQLFCKLL